MADDAATPAPRRSRMPEGWEPPVPAWAARFSVPSGTVVMGYFGAQGPAGEGEDHFTRMDRFFAGPDGPDNVERSAFTDRAGLPNALVAAYWTSPLRYESWRAASGYEAWWSAPDRLSGPSGSFEEILTLPTDRFETLFSTENLVGAAATGQCIHGPIREHNYWGAMRDRIAVSGASDLASRYGEALPRLGRTVTLGLRLRVTAPENLAVIRSGQDWSRCHDAELDDYARSVRPVLVSGMDFLRDHPDETGCCDMRLAAEVAAGGAPVEKSFGLGYFLSLAHLERWAESHPTHLAIFHRFLAMAGRHKALDLRLWHEVAVLPGAGQRFEYVNCHPQTGLLPYFPAEEPAPQ
jgi:hypothetical protein